MFLFLEEAYWGITNSDKSFGEWRTIVHWSENSSHNDGIAERQWQRRCVFGDGWEYDYSMKWKADNHIYYREDT